MPVYQRVNVVSDPTPDQVRALWTFMSSKYHSVVVSKSSSEFMQVVGDFLGKLKITDTESFMKNYSTTIGNRIYVPFEVGVANDEWDLWNQMVVCAHENHHVSQQNTLGAVPFDWQYVTDGDARARLEAAAYLCDAELDFWRYGTLSYEPKDLATLISGYGCNDAQVGIASDMLNSLGKTVLAGGVVTDTSRDVIAWLEQNAPGVKGS